MTTTKVYGCGGRYSFLNFFPCSSCISKENIQDCKDILKNYRTSKHKEWCSDMHGRMWNRTPVEYYKLNPLNLMWEVSIEDSRALTLRSESECS